MQRAAVALTGPGVDRVGNVSHVGVGVFNCSVAMMGRSRFVLQCEGGANAVRHVSSAGNGIRRDGGGITPLTTTVVTGPCRWEGNNF